MLRWLLPIVALLTLLGRSVTTYAAAGSFGDPTCCCPVKTECKCHDHDGEAPQPTLKRCGGEATLVAPAIAVAIAEVPIVLALVPRVTHTPAPAPRPLTDSFARRPEKPPS